MFPDARQVLPLAYFKLNLCYTFIQFPVQFKFTIQSIHGHNACQLFASSRFGRVCVQLQFQKKLWGCWRMCLQAVLQSVLTFWGNYFFLPWAQLIMKTYCLLPCLDFHMQALKKQTNKQTWFYIGLLPGSIEEIDDSDTTAAWVNFKAKSIHHSYK